MKEVPVSSLMYMASLACEMERNAFIAQLAEDIKNRGVKRPLIVRPVGDMFEVVCGLKRWKAAIIAGLATVPVDIRVLSDDEALKLNLSDNRR